MLLMSDLDGFHPSYILNRAFMLCVGWVQPIKIRAIIYLLLGLKTEVTDLTNYRRNFIPGGSYFFTVALADRQQSLLTENIKALRHAFYQTKQQKPFYIDAIVVLPEHLHAVLTLPEGDCDFSNRWRLIKGTFSASFLNTEARSVSRLSKGERGIWQRRFWEHTLRDRVDYQRHVDYIHYNPVKHGYVLRVVDWPYSSFHRAVNYGVLPKDWAGGDCDDSGVFGE